MRAVIQRVSEASVAIDGRAKAAIKNGLLVLLAIEETDSAEDMEWLSGKLARLRIFGDECGGDDRSVKEIQGDILVVSQFTCWPAPKKEIDLFTVKPPDRKGHSVYELFVRKLTRIIVDRAVVGQAHFHVRAKFTGLHGMAQFLGEFANKQFVNRNGHFRSGGLTVRRSISFFGAGQQSEMADDEYVA